MRVRLNHEELNYLLSSELLPPALQAKVAPPADTQESYVLEISEDEADDLRELAAERLLAEGFDENYQPNPTGRILETLIDKFFVA